jgi:hypothetical protein
MSLEVAHRSCASEYHDISVTNAMQRFISAKLLESSSGALTCGNRACGRTRPHPTGGGTSGMEDHKQNLTVRRRVLRRSRGGSRPGGRVVSLCGWALLVADVAVMMATVAS